MAAQSGQLSRLITNRMLSRLRHQQLALSRKFTNRAQGEHRVRSHGQSTEFAEHRDYVEGDDIRYLDWHLFARLRKPYIKKYHHEEQITVFLLIDTSRSMGFEGKLELALSMAAALGHMVLSAQEKLAIYAFGQSAFDDARHMPRIKGMKDLPKMLQFLESLEAEGDQSLEQAVEKSLKAHRGRGAAIILSDFMTQADLGSAFSRLQAAGLSVNGLQILAPQELTPPLEEDLRLTDIESQEQVDITLNNDVLETYQRMLSQHKLMLEAQCRKRHGRFFSCDSSQDPESLLFTDLRRAGWIRGK